MRLARVQCNIITNLQCLLFFLRCKPFFFQLFCAGIGLILSKSARGHRRDVAGQRIVFHGRKRGVSRHWVLARRCGTNRHCWRRGN